MREKDIETDYRFMPESNLLSVHIKPQWLEEAKAAVRKPQYLRNIQDFGIEPHTSLSIAVSEM